MSWNLTCDGCNGEIDTAGISLTGKGFILIHSRLDAFDPEGKFTLKSTGENFNTSKRVLCPGCAEWIEGAIKKAMDESYNNPGTALGEFLKEVGV